MRLVTRVSAFFLAALAAVQVGLSITVYMLASGYLFRQIDQRIDTALDILEAAVDVEPDGLEWEPRDRRITLGIDPSAENVRWAVLDGNGNLLDHSGNWTPEFPIDWRPAAWPTDSSDQTLFGKSPGWRVGTRRLVLEVLLRYGRGHPEDDSLEDDQEFPVLVLLAGVSPSGAQASLRLLAITLGGLSTSLWIACALIGRRFSRRALEPLSTMADAVRRMNAATLDERLPVPATHDELAELGEAFNAMLDRLSESRDRQARFAGDASHQLRTPLAGMLSMVDVLRRRERSIPEYVDALDKLHHEALRMRQIVESLLFLARDTSQEMTLASEAIDFDAWLPQRLAAWREHPRYGDLQFAPGAARSIIALGQPALLAQLLDIMIENACKFSEAGTPIVIETIRKQSFVGFAVVDHGTGIAEQDLPRLFEPFYRSANARRDKRPGVGLGLAIAQRIVSTMHGQIDVTSIVGLGARFEALLPEAAGAVPNKSPGDFAETSPLAANT